MPASLTFVVPGGFDLRWSLLGRALRRRTGDRLRAEALQIALLTAAVLAGLMGVYAVGAIATLLGQSALVPGIVLAGAVLVALLGGAAGMRPRAVVTAGAEAVTVERGDERLRLPYGTITSIEVVGARRFHQHERRYAAVRPFRGKATTPVLVLRGRGGPVVALGLRAEDRQALRRHVEERAEADGHPRSAAQPPAMTAR